MITRSADRFYEAKIDGVDCDGDPGVLEVCVSREEWQGVQIAIQTHNTFTDIELDPVDVGDLIQALHDAVAYADGG